MSSRLIAAWFGSGFTTIVLPLIIFWIARATNSYNNNQYNNNNNNGNNNNNNYNNNNNGNDTPWWYFGGNGEEQRKEEGAPTILVAAYLWSLLVFLVILWYGHSVLSNTSKPDNNNNGVVVALALFANFSLLSLFLFGGVEGAVETEGRAVEEHGFAGQFGVMMYLTSLLWMVFSIAFGVVFYRNGKKSKNVTQIEVESADYRIHKSEDV